MSAKTISKREPDAKFDLTIPDNVPELFVDGISHTTFGLPFTKLVFHSIHPEEGAKDGVEPRRAVLVMTIQTETLMEICTKVLGALIENEGQLASGYKYLEGRLQSHMAAAKAIGTRTKK